jgi:hypothetical protein
MVVQLEHGDGTEWLLHLGSRSVELDRNRIQPKREHHD